MSMTIQSPAFQHLQDIPSRHTCDGMDTSPALSWAGLPPGTRSLVLIVDDPDAPDPAAPEMTFVHWVVYNIPPDVSGIEEGAAPAGLPLDAEQGLNDWHNKAWGGPCPPIGRHRYFFKLYALNATLPHLRHPTKGAVEEAMRGHILAQAELIGLYRKH